MPSSARRWIGLPAVLLVISVGCSLVLPFGQLTQGDDETDAAPAADADADADADAAPSEGAPACAPIDAALPPPSDAACAVSDGSTCAPGPIVGFSPHYAPPRAASSSCSTPQLSSYWTACLGSTQSQAACNTFREKSAVCAGCLYSTSTDTKWGPLVMFDVSTGTYYLNVAGCVALLDPCNVGCAESIESYIQCTYASCIPACAGASPSSIVACADDKARVCPCQDYSAPATNCTDTLGAVAGPARACFQAMVVDQQSFAAVAGVFCGGG